MSKVSALSIQQRQEEVGMVRMGQQVELPMMILGSGCGGRPEEAASLQVKRPSMQKLGKVSGGGEGGDVGGQGDGERGGRDGREAAGARGADEGGHGEEGGGAQGAPGMDSIMSSPLSPISDTPTRGVKRGTRSDSLIGQTSLAEEDPFEGDDDEEEEHPRRSKRRTNSSQMQEVEARIALIGSITEGNEVQVGEGYGLAPNIP